MEKSSEKDSLLNVYFMINERIRRIEPDTTEYEILLKRLDEIRDEINEIRIKEIKEKMAKDLILRMLPIVAFMKKRKSIHESE